MNLEALIRNTFAEMFGLRACYFALAAIGLNIQFGYAGLLNFGQAAFMAAGAYGIAMTTATVMGISIWWGILVGIGFSILLGLLMGIPTLRLRADYLAMVTIAVAEIVRLVVRSQWATSVFGGSNGFNTFARDFQAVGVKIGLQPATSYGFWAFRFSGRTLWVLLVGWSLVTLFGLLVWALMRSPWGRVLKAIREDEEAVRSLGKNVYGFKMQALIFGGIVGTFAGMVLAVGQAAVVPDAFSRDLTFNVLTALVIGGVAKVSGSIVGAMLFWALYSFLESLLRQILGGRPLNLKLGGLDIQILTSTQVGAVVYMVLGLVLVLLMAFRPQGLFGNRKEMAFDDR